MINLLKKETKLKGRKVYSVVSRRGTICLNFDSIDEAIRALDSDFPIIVEKTITRVFTRENELKEIEIDPIK